LSKAITLLNLTKKILSRKVYVEYTPWFLRDTIGKVDLADFEYEFQCPRGYDFNVFLNPYFHEYDVVLLACSVLRKGDVFVDVGAHGGLYTLIGALQVGSQGQVIAIEPNPHNLKVLRQNVELNQLDNVLIIPKAASEERSTINLYYETSRTAFTSAVMKASRVFRTEAITLDDVTTTNDCIKLLKVDTEGYDLRVLKGGRETLQRTSFVVVEQNNDLVRKMLSSFGFRLCTLTSSEYLVAIHKKLSHFPLLQKIFADGLIREEA